MKKLIPILFITMTLTTGCKTADWLSAGFDLWKPDKAFLVLSPEVLGNPFKVLTICTILPLFILAGFASFLINRGNIKGWYLLCIVAGLVLTLVATPYFFLPVMAIVGKEMYPDGLTLSFLTDRLTTVTAVALTIMAPVLHELWELVLVVLLAIFIPASAISRSLKPLLIIFGAVIAWQMFYPLLYVEVYALQAVIPANLATAVVNDVTKGYDAIYLIMLLGTQILVYFVAPAATAFAYSMNAGDNDTGNNVESHPARARNANTFFIPIPAAGGSTPSGTPSYPGGYGTNVWPGYPPGYMQHEALPPPSPSSGPGGNRESVASSEEDPNVVEGVVEEIRTEQLPYEPRGSYSQPPPVTPGADTVKPTEQLPYDQTGSRASGGVSKNTQEPPAPVLSKLELEQLPYDSQGTGAGGHGSNQGVSPVATPPISLGRESEQLPYDQTGGASSGVQVTTSPAKVRGSMPGSEQLPYDNQSTGVGGHGNNQVGKPLADANQAGSSEERPQSRSPLEDELLP